MKLRLSLFLALSLPVCGGLEAEIFSKPAPNYGIVPEKDDDLTRSYLAFYLDKSRRPEVIRALERSHRYREIIFRSLAEEGLPSELFYLPMIESGYDADAVSHAGAVGLWQLMPQTARLQGLTVSTDIDERRDPEKSTKAALRHLKALHVTFQDWPLALAAYNCGAAKLRSTLLRGTTLPLETRHFVPKFKAAVLIGESYGFTPPPSERQYFHGSPTLQIARLSPGNVSATLKELGPDLRALNTSRYFPDFFQSGRSATDSGALSVKDIGTGSEIR